MPDPSVSPVRRNRSATMIAIPQPQQSSSTAGPSRPNQLSSTPRNITEPSTSVATAALSSHLIGSVGMTIQTDLSHIPASATGPRRPRLASSKTSHARVQSWSSPPHPIVTTIPSAPSIPTRSSLEAEADPLFPRDRATLLLYTYRPNNLTSNQAQQPSPLPSLGPSNAVPPSMVHFAHAALPWKVRPGDYVEIRRVHREEPHNLLRQRGMGVGPSGPGDGKAAGGDALKDIAKNMGRDTYIFRVGEDMPNIPINQIQVPESVAAAFRFQHRSEVELVKMSDTSEANIDFVELRFSQYLGRADMWRLAMSLEGTTVHVGERLSLAGGAVRAEVQGIWRNQHRHASGILTAKTKTIYRSRSAQVYLFIQLCQETWEFDEDGERYYEKVVHGFLPEIFNRWNEKGTSHLVTIILFARVHYTDEEVSYLEKNDMGEGLIKDYAGRWCKDFFRVVIDFERRSDWNLALAEIKRRLERSEGEILLYYHLDELAAKHPDSTEKKRIVGKWSFAYEGNVLEAVNLALNPFDEHYVDRDLSRTGLNIAVITPGTGHFAVDKNLLRLTTERMIDHGICLELVCLTKMPLHSVPLFSYVSKRPTKPVWETANSGVKTKPATPDLLYFDSHLSSATDCELADCYSIPKWVNSSYYSKTHDKPFRKDRFVPRCKMYEIQMLGILDHNLTTVTVPLLDIDDLPRARKDDTAATEERKAAHDEFDASIFRPVVTEEAKSEITRVRSRDSGAVSGSGVVASYQSARLLAIKAEESKSTPVPTPSMNETIKQDTPAQTSPLISRTITAEASPRTLPKTARSDSNASRSPFNRLRDLPPFEPLDLQRTDVRAASPAPSTLSLARTTRERSSSKASEPQGEPISGQSTPKVTPARKLNTKSSKSSFGSRFGGNWLLTALTGRSQPSFPIAAAETVGRQDVSSVTGNGFPSPVSAKSSPALPRAVPGAPTVTPSTPSPSRVSLPISAQQPSNQSAVTTQPVPIASKRHRMTSDDEPIKSFRNSYKASRSPLTDSWSKAAAANFNRSKSHVTVNPCNPKENDDTSFGEGRRWQHVRPKPARESQHLVKWRALTAPACLPLTTDFMPTTQEIQDFYEFNSYDIACYPDQVSFLVRPDAANTNLPLAVMREMASQRLSQNFQFITLPHDHDPAGELNGKASTTRKVLLPGDSTKDGLRVGGASEVLRNARGAIYLLWSNHIHRLAFDPLKQSVTVQRFVRKLRFSMEPVRYTCLVWPAQMNSYQPATTMFKYPNVEAKLNFNYLDRLIAGEEEDLTSNLRYWRTRYILIPSGRDPVAGVVPKGEQFNHNEILISGAFKVLEIIGKNQWKREGQSDVPLRLLPTTFDPSACVLDDGLMIELERLNKGEEQHPAGKALEGMTLQTVAEMMCQPNNGLVIRDRWWNFNVHEDSFTGEQFTEWLLNTFSDIKTVDEAADWGRSLFDKGLIEHVTAAHGFFNYGHFFYRLRREYDLNKNKRKRPAKGWFGGKPTEGPRDLLERHAAMSNFQSAMEPLGKLGEGPKDKHKRKIKMSQSVIIDLDPLRKSDRAEVAVLHADIIHNARTAFHFELNWLGVTAGLLDELRAKCAAQAERYGLRFVEAPVEQIKDVSQKCAYRAPIPIPLALAPPVIPDLHLRLANQGHSGQVTNWFEYAILTHKFGFVLDVEASSRYPENVQVEYSYRGQTPFEYSQFCHRSGLALVQCMGGEAGYLWCDNRLFIAAPTRGRGGNSSIETYPNAPVPAKLTRQEEARALRKEFEAFCNNVEELRKFYEEITPPALDAELAAGVVAEVNGEKDEAEEVDKEKEKGEEDEKDKEQEASGGSQSGHR